MVNLRHLLSPAKPKPAKAPAPGPSSAPPVATTGSGVASGNPGAVVAAAQGQGGAPLNAQQGGYLPIGGTFSFTPTLATYAPVLLPDLGVRYQIFSQGWKENGGV